MVQGAAGLVGLVTLAWLISEDRARVSWRKVGAGLAAQFTIALLLLKVPAAQGIFLVLNRLVDTLSTATRAGTSFVFGYVGGGPAPFAINSPSESFVLAFQALPLVMVISAVSALLYHWRILPFIVQTLSRILEKLLGLGGAVGMSAAAMPFLGLVESPLLIRPYLSKMSRGELFVVMTGGMATIAGTVMVLYATFLQNVIPNAIGHLLTASLISIPAAITVARIMIPDDMRTGGHSLTQQTYSGTMDAVVKGTLDGAHLMVGIAAMLVVLVALVHLGNDVLALAPDVAHAPLTWLMGIPAPEMLTAGALMGTKTVLNELLAYLALAHLPEEALSSRSRIIMTYGLCGFANFGSLGILIAGLSSMAPERRSEVVALGGKALVSGTLASCLTGAVVGLVL